MASGKNFSDWILLLLLSLIWGSSFILMKKGLIHYTPAQVASLRLLWAFMFFLPFLFFIGIKGLRQHFKGLVWMGLFGNLIPAFLFTAAEARISSSLAGILNATTPLFAWLWGKFFFKNKDSRPVLVITGLLTGFAGVLVLFIPEIIRSDISSGIFASTFTGSLMVLMATLCYGLSVQGIHRYLKNVAPLHASVWAMCLLAFPSGIFLFSTGNLSLDAASLRESMVYIGILGIAGSGISLILYNSLIQSAGPVFAASCTYLMPFISLFWGWMDKENLNIFHICGLVLLLSGLFFLKKGND